jgi:hypothetical protein
MIHETPPSNGKCHCYTSNNLQMFKVIRLPLAKKYPKNGKTKVDATVRLRTQPGG